MSQPNNEYSEKHYFASYDHIGIHEEMLKDEVRTTTYRQAIYNSKHLFKGKVVLDVGCGTGILSMFAARSGAALVIGVDMSSIIETAKKLAEDNDLGDKIVFLRGKMEEVKLPVDKVDIIISEWMGYFLLYESMLDTVICARDMYLKPDGLIFPDHATLKIAGIEDGAYKAEKIDFWDDVYGFDFSRIKQTALREPIVDIVEAGAIVTTASSILEIDLYTVTVKDLEFRSDFNLIATRTDYLHALVGWFDIKFTKCHKPLYFSTGPHARYTHWKQTVFYLHDILSINAGEKITGEITCKPNDKNHRDLEFTVSYEFSPADAGRAMRATHEYLLC
ncbi:hypothetical protein CANCADRAFT_4452 [Tortispora caseinolytica NRRL Y-17796]|uniref:type I protein arginine methyltransferase n=1 Tax=Tortispora caseinolytica NRRL Y-17796 TaxID=767744 RepID=A0A1E4TDI1_9ASCO|nr:hypothetical protein CANCADRAFT_4452 [Tortispora caseinolytica NRRL Y-17796]